MFTPESAEAQSLLPEKILRWGNYSTNGMEYYHKTPLFRFLASLYARTVIFIIVELSKSLIILWVEDGINENGDQ